MARRKITVHKHDKKLGQLETFMDSIILDPNALTRLVMIGAGSSMIGRIDGQWGPGLAGPFFGPGGDPNTVFNGNPKFCCMITAIDAMGNVVAPPIMDDPPDGWEVDNPQAFPVWVVAFMNILPHSGNIVNPANPMRATIGV